MRYSPFLYNTLFFNIITMSHFRITLYQYLTALILLVSVAAAFGWNNFTPPGCDDMSYMVIADGVDQNNFWGVQGEHIESWEQVWRGITGHFGFINGRLANILAIPALYAGEPTTTILKGLFLSAFLVLTALVGDYRRRLTVWSAMLSAVLVWSAMPWYDYFHSLDFQANYVWTCVMLLGLMLLMPRLRTMRPLGLLLTCLLAFATGMMHEGFAMVFLVYLAASAIVEPTYRSRAMLLMSVALVAGLLVDLFGGTLGRAQLNETVKDYSVLRDHLTRMISSMWPLGVALVGVACEWFLCRRSRRQRLWRRLPLLAAALAGAAMPPMLMLFDRVYWPMDFFAMLLIINIATEGLDRLSERAAIVAAMIFVPLYAAWAYQLCTYQKVIYDEYQRTVAQFEERQAAGEPFAGVFYTDSFLHDDDIPFYLMEIVRQPMQQHFSNERLASFYGRRYDSYVPLPERFRGKPFEELPPIPGTNKLRGYWPFILSRDSIDEHMMATMGPQSPNTPLFERLLAAVGVTSPDSTSHIFTYFPRHFRTPEGDSLWTVCLLPQPRTFRYRPLLRIDTIDRRTIPLPQ